MKPTDEATSPDPRMSFLVARDRATGEVEQLTLAHVHRELDAVTLVPGVPEDVREQFEIARNLALYSWFVYEFNAPAQLWALATLELGLRRRFNEPDGARAPNLTKLLQRAAGEGLIDVQDLIDCGVPAPMSRQEQRELVKTGKMPAALSYRDRAIDFLAQFRNELGHGNRLLWPNTSVFIHATGRLLNSLFSKTAG